MPLDMSGVTSQDRLNQPGNVIDAVYADPSEQDVSIEDFLNLICLLYTSPSPRD